MSEDPLTNELAAWHETVDTLALALADRSPTVRHAVALLMRSLRQAVEERLLSAEQARDKRRGSGG